MADITSIVDVQIQLDTPGTPRRDFGKTLLLTTDAGVLDATGSGRVRQYTKYSDVEAAYGTTVKDAAAAYFAQDPRPNALLIGRRASGAVNHEVRGGAPSAVGTINDVNAGSFRFAGVDFTGTDFSSANAYADVASTLQAKIRGQSSAPDLSAATVRYQASPSRFVVSTLATIDEVDGVFGAHSSGTGTDVSEILGLTAGEGATFHPGGGSEAVGDSLSAILGLSGVAFSQFFLDPAQDGSADMVAAGRWANANRRFFYAASSEASVLSSADQSGTQAHALAELDHRYAAGIYSRTADGKAAAMAGYFSSINFDTSGSLRTGNLADLVGTADDVFTATEEALIGAIKFNFTGYDGRMVPGNTLAAATDWIDVRLWATWFQDALQTDIFAQLAGNRIPLTNAGLQILKDTITKVCEQGIVNGGIAPSGEATADMKAEIRQVTGNDDFDGQMSKGYLVWVPSIATLTKAQRAARTAPAFRIWCLGGGFIHGVEVNVSFTP